VVVVVGAGVSLVVVVVVVVGSGVVVLQSLPSWNSVQFSKSQHSSEVQTEPPSGNSGQLTQSTPDVQISHSFVA
jgi:hypothetical protein